MAEITEREETTPRAGEGAARARFQSGQVATIALGHFTHDTYSAFLAPLLPIIQERLAVGYALAGGLAIFTQLPGLLNPFIGYLADRVSLRYFIIFAPAVTASLMSAVGLAGDYAMLAILLLGVGISTAAFHAPAPAMIGRVAGRRVGTGMSIFMASGELARTLGPIVAVAGVNWLGLEGMWRLALAGWLVSAILYWRLRGIHARPRIKAPAGLAAAWPQIRRLFPLLAWLLLGRVFLQAALTTYLPLFVSDVLGANLWLAAASLTILEGAGVVGALLGGTLSDRLGRAPVLLLALGLAPLLLLAFLWAPSWLVAPLLVGLGLTAISAQPVLLALVQDSFPHHRAAANGAYLALNFLMRAGGIWAIGLLADHYGLSRAFLFSALISFISLPAVYLLPQAAIDHNGER